MDLFRRGVYLERIIQISLVDHHSTTECSNTLSESDCCGLPTYLIGGCPGR